MSKSLRSKAADMTEKEQKLLEEDEDNMIVAVYESSPGLIAIDNETGKIVGVVLTVLSKRPENEEDGASVVVYDSYTFKSAVMNDYYKYFSQMDKAAGIFKKYPNAEAAVELFAIVVHKEHRRKGLAKDLTLNGINLAKSIPGVGVVFGIYTSEYSKKVAEQIGLKSVMDFDLETDFINHNGEPAFSNMKPNNIVSLMALGIRSW